MRDDDKWDEWIEREAAAFDRNGWPEMNAVEYGWLKQRFVRQQSKLAIDSSNKHTIKLTIYINIDSILTTESESNIAPNLRDNCIIADGNAEIGCAGTKVYYVNYFFHILF